MTSFLQRVLGLATAAAMSVLSGEVNAGQVGPEPINTPSLTFPGDTVSPPILGRQGIVQSVPRPTVLVAEAKPPVTDRTPLNPPQPPRTIIDVINDQGEIIRKGQKDSAEKFRSLPPVPGN